MGNTRERNLRNPKRPRWVYFIREVNRGNVKIGSSINPAARLLELQPGNPETLILVGKIVGGIALEFQFHTRFAAHRLNGEWFAPSKELDALIGELFAAGSAA